MEDLKQSLKGLGWLIFYSTYVSTIRVSAEL
ncbi:Uncharacterised protein [Staphylococcus aureus]|nr:Uncharacterised protein [Staphylococcus aureus]